MDALLSETQSTAVTGRLPIRNPRVAVLKVKEADETLCSLEPETTSNDHLPFADGKENAVLNKSASSGVYVPDEGHNSNGTGSSAAMGKI
jgi:hypothetical protein